MIISKYGTLLVDLCVLTKKLIWGMEMQARSKNLLSTYRFSLYILIIFILKGLHVALLQDQLGFLKMRRKFVFAQEKLFGKKEMSLLIQKYEDFLQKAISIFIKIQFLVFI